MIRTNMIRWSCSDYVHHEHRTKWTASICGYIQYIIKKIKIKLCNAIYDR